MKELFSFGPIHIYIFGLMIAIAAIAGGAFAIKQGEKRGIFSAIVAGYLYSIKSKVSFLKLAEIAVVGIALAQGIGRVGCDVFGKPVTNIMMWGVNYLSFTLYKDRHIK